MEVVFDGISPSSFEATSWSFAAMNVWDEVRPFKPGGRMAYGGHVIHLDLGCPLLLPTTMPVMIIFSTIFLFFI